MSCHFQPSGAKEGGKFRLHVGKLLRLGSNFKKPIGDLRAPPICASNLAENFSFTSHLSAGRRKFLWLTLIPYGRPSQPNQMTKVDIMLRLSLALVLNLPFSTAYLNLVELLRYKPLNTAET